MIFVENTNESIKSEYQNLPGDFFTNLRGILTVQVVSLTNKIRSNIIECFLVEKNKNSAISRVKHLIPRFSPVFDNFHHVIFHKNSLISANNKSIFKNHTPKFKLAFLLHNEKNIFKNQLSDKGVICC